MVEFGVESVDNGHRRNIGRGDLVAEGGYGGIPRINCHLDYLQMHITVFGTLQITHLLVDVGNCFGLSHETQLGSLQIRNIVENHLVDGSLVFRRCTFLEELLSHIPITSIMFAQLIENKEQFFKRVFGIEIVILVFLVDFGSEIFGVDFVGVVECLFKKYWVHAVIIYNLLIYIIYRHSNYTIQSADIFMLISLKIIHR